MFLSSHQGCDASVLLSSPSNNAEKDHPDDISLAGDGFDTVIKAKAAVDSNPRCRNKVSCADILALATRDVVALVCKSSSLDSLVCQ
jgi:peroxidase